MKEQVRRKNEEQRDLLEKFEKYKTRKDKEIQELQNNLEGTRREVAVLV